MDDKDFFIMARIKNITIGVLFLATAALFFYGLINNIQAKKDKELARQIRIQLKECEQKTDELTKKAEVTNAQLTQALNAAKIAIKSAGKE
jgi:hypothetical protein